MAVNQIWVRWPRFGHEAAHSGEPVAPQPKIGLMPHSLGFGIRLHILGFPV
jgi:hypothetical protein